jgi:hypothetical protein
MAEQLNLTKGNSTPTTTGQPAPGHYSDSDEGDDSTALQPQPRAIARGVETGSNGMGSTGPADNGERERRGKAKQKGPRDVVGEFFCLSHFIVLLPTNFLGC